MEALTAAVEDAIRCGVTDVLALDGRYRHFPGDSWTSPPEQAEAIAAVCAKHRILCTIESIEDSTEVEKRTRLFDMAYEAGATREDWLFIVDADHRVSRARDLKPILEDATGDCFNVYGVEGDTGRFRVTDRGRWARLVFRAVPGLHVSSHSHWHYLDADNRVLWGFNSIPAEDLPIVVINRSTNRAKQRTKGRDRYYAKRNATDTIEAERLPLTCYDCDAPPEPTPLAADWTVGELPDGTYGAISRRTLFCCAAHAPKWKAREEHSINQDLANLIRTQPHVALQVRDQMVERYKLLEREAAWGA